MSLSIEIEREEDRRGLAEVPEIPGVLVYGTTPKEAIQKVQLMGISSDMLVIGDDGCCNCLSIGILGSRRGQVFYIDHEFVPGEPKRERFLALPFKDFLSRLRVGPD